jgi:hypothetical protein
MRPIPQRISKQTFPGRGGGAIEKESDVSAIHSGAALYSAFKMQPLWLLALM